MTFRLFGLPGLGQAKKVKKLIFLSQFSYLNIFVSIAQGVAGLPGSWDVRMIWPKSSQLGPKSSHGWDDFQSPGPPGGVPGGLPLSRTRPGAQTLNFLRF